MRKAHRQIRKRSFHSDRPYGAIHHHFYHISQKTNPFFFHHHSRGSEFESQGGGVRGGLFIRADKPSGATRPLTPHGCGVFSMSQTRSRDHEVEVEWTREERPSLKPQSSWPTSNMLRAFLPHSFSGR